ncbi:TPA: response regulator transcription factor [Serratia fonticola]
MIYIISDDNYFSLGAEEIFLSAREKVTTINANSHKDKLRTLSFTSSDVLILSVENAEIITLMLAIARFSSSKVLFVVDNTSERTMININSWSQGVLSKKTPTHLFARVVDIDMSYLKAVPLLTLRETCVMNYLAQGKTPYKISKELNISIKTVCAHKISALRKLGLNHLNARSVLIYERIFQGTPRH